MEARIKFHSQEIKKTGLNKFAGYSYFELADFLPIAQKIFSEVGLCGVVSYGKEIATLTISDFETMDKIEITSPMADAMLKGCHPIQNLGAVETYTRRYLWVTALELVEHDILDSSEPIKPSAGSRKENGTLVGKGVVSDTTGVFESLSTDTQTVVIDTAKEIDAMAKVDIKKAIEIFKSAYINDDGEVDNEIKIAIWSKLGSQVRSKIKEHGDGK